jgi:acyl dehydratase
VTRNGSTSTPSGPRAGPFGTTIAHGYLTLSLIVPLFVDLLDVEGVTTKLNYGLNKVRFPAPVKVDSRIRLVAQITEVEVRSAAAASRSPGPAPSRSKARTSRPASPSRSTASTP